MSGLWAKELSVYCEFGIRSCYGEYETGIIWHAAAADADGLCGIRTEKIPGETGL